jgi:hypothetical protein
VHHVNGTHAIPIMHSYELKVTLANYHRYRYTFMSTLLCRHRSLLLIVCSQVMDDDTCPQGISILHC